MIKLKHGNGPTIRGRKLTDTGASVTHDAVPVQTSGGTTTPITIDDANFNAYTAATYYLGGNVAVEGMGSHEIINRDPSVGSVSAQGQLTRNSSGVMRLLVRNKIVTLPLTIDMTDKSEGPDQPKVYVSAVTGSLAEHCQQQIDSRINSGMTMQDNGRIFTTQNHATATYVRNPNVWCSDVDLTCISPWNSNGGTTKAGVLITQRHVLGAAHYEYPVGTVVRFVAADNTVHDRTVIGKATHPDYQPFYPDLCVYTLSADLPESITPCEMMSSIETHFLSQNHYTRPPALCLDQEEKALIADFVRDGSFQTPIDADRLIFHENKIAGDSGNPAFLIVNGKLVLVTVWTGGGAGSGTPVSQFLPDIYDMISFADEQAGVSTDHSIVQANFTSFNNYS